jgi:hypothetical protein
LMQSGGESTSAKGFRRWEKRRRKKGKMCSQKKLTPKNWCSYEP